MQDLEALPFFAILALGAWCAQRVSPLFRTWKGVSEQHARSVPDAAQAVENLAACPDSAARAPLWAPVLDATLLAADAATAADIAGAPSTAIHAADAAAELADAIDPEGSRESAARAVCKTIRASTEALDPTDPGGRGAFLPELTALVGRLRGMASSEGWTDETGVSIHES